jgi:hypothetical protein
LRNLKILLEIAPSLLGLRGQSLHRRHHCGRTSSSLPLVSTGVGEDLFSGCQRLVGILAGGAVCLGRRLGTVIVICWCVHDKSVQVYGGLRGDFSSRMMRRRFCGQEIAEGNAGSRIKIV